MPKAVTQELYGSAQELGFSTLTWAFVLLHDAQVGAPGRSTRRPLSQVTMTRSVVEEQARAGVDGDAGRLVVGELEVVEVEHAESGC